MHTIQTYEEEQEESALSRIHFWTVAVDMAMANPTLGIGFNGFNRTYDDYDFSDGKYGRGRSVHSSFFSVLAELGYIGFFLYLAILWGAFGACFQVRKLSCHHHMAAEMVKGAAALEASLVAFVVGGSFVPWQYNEMLWHVIGLSIVLQRIGTQYEGQTLETGQLIDLSSPPSLKGRVAA
jgi:O-antigen ligase